MNLNKVGHQFPENSTDSTQDCKSLTSKESNVDASMVKLSGVPPLPKSLPVPRACVKVHANVTENRRTPNRSSAFNGSLSDSSQQCSVSRFTPQCNQQKKPQIKICLPPRSSAYGECKVYTDQHILAGRRANPHRIACAYVPECSTSQGGTTDVPMTEEEKAAKRRENWRIKKREQRAKRAEKLKKDKERTQCFEKGRQEIGKLSCVAPTRPLHSVNTMALREAKQPNAVKSVDLLPSDGKPVHFTVKVGSDVLPPRQKQSPSKPPSAKVDTQGSMAKNLSLASVSSTHHLQHLKPVLTQNLRLPISSGVSLSSSSFQATNQPKIQQQKLMHAQRRQSLPQWNDRVETAEERHAKQREYWRIKKRLQRARLSVQMKAHMKERDALKQCPARYQGNLEQVRKTTGKMGFQRVLQPNRNKLISASETVNNLIKEDGTISVSVSKTSAEIPSAAASCSVRAVKSSHPASPSALHSQRLVYVRARSAVHGIPNRMNSTGNIHQRSIGQNTSTVAPVVRTGLANSRTHADIPKGLTKACQAVEPNQQDRTGCRGELRSSHASSGLTQSSDLVPPGTIKQEPSYPSIESVYSLAQQSHNMDIKNVKPAPSPPLETKVAKEVASGCDNQATTLLVVASMKKLLEESLSSVAETQTSSTGQDVLFPCKTEDELSPQETETSVKPDLTPQHGYTDPSIDVKQSPPLCHSPPQAPDFSAEDTVLSCQGSVLQIPCPIVAESPSPSQNSEGRTHNLSVAVGVRPVHRGTQAHSGRRARLRHGGPPQACGGQQQNERSELQKKREYWRVMKRRQRARKAKEKERSKYAVQHKQLFQPIQRKSTSYQLHHPSVTKLGSHTNRNDHAVLPAVPPRPARLVLSPTESNQQPSNGSKTTFSETSQVKKWQLQTCALTPSTRPDTVTSTRIMNHVKPFPPQMQNRRPCMTNLRTKQNHFKAAANQGLDPEEILRRKRMQWRIKKQEQRARKAAQERELSHQAKLGLDLYNNITEVVQSTPPDRPGYQLAQCQVTPLKDEAELFFVPDDNGSEEPLSEAKWRSTYLMDYDPINQLLVCMVCGEQQYCLSVEGVKAHIEEAHPGTLSLDEQERSRILQAWDEQVAMRERFFTNQLWQQSGALEEKNTTHTAEIEVTLDAEDMKHTNARTS
ncbi:uncharacterized protein [Salminus brasiliensis]